ncbi:Hypothetical predicted protein [Cloeon dipterum]|nr:Hypothetical predicted protein [Cloeon dipterum]
MTLSPFLPVKPANPQIFMDAKGRTLNNLLSAAPGRRALDAAAPPAADPAGMAAKKADFLNKLFGGLGPVVASPDPAAPPAFWSPPAAPAPPADDFATQAQKLAQLVSATLSEPVATEAPAPAFPFLFAPIPTTPKPTIVPPGFWLPSSPIAAPGEYVNKVSEFLEKLFASKMPTPAAPAARSLAARHHEHNPYVDLERYVMNERDYFILLPLYSGARLALSFSFFIHFFRVIKSTTLYFHVPKSSSPSCYLAHCEIRAPGDLRWQCI